MRRETNFFNAINWLHPSLILCNKIPQIDESIWDNLEGNIEDDSGEYLEVYQWFLTSFSDDDVEFMKRSFDMGCIYTYSDLLECWCVGVTHYGTAWDGVPATCLNDDISDASL